ncbi:MAG: rubrerythrin family protein [Desulfobacteraceae bacterium]|jgi:rubrerythrin
MGEKTEKNLGKAFAAESKASLRNAAFALKAEKEEYLNAAKLFKAVADSESVHANRFLLLMRGKIGSTEENLKTAFENEIKANADEYPQLIKEAEDEGANNAEMKALTQTRDVEERHAQLYKSMLNDMMEDRETDYYVCQICGYIAENEIPETCPVCGAVASRFKAIA